MSSTVLSSPLQMTLVQQNRSKMLKMSKYYSKSFRFYINRQLPTIMKLNDAKFELLRYGSNAQIKEETHYTSPSGNKIEEKNFVKDLGVLMSNDCLFKNQIDTIIEKAKNLISWILQTFYFTHN